MGEESGLKYPRALVKISGESLAGEQGFGIEPPVIEELTREIRDVYESGVKLGLVVGGGNIVRGTVASEQGMDRVSADYMGMLATVINGINQEFETALSQLGAGHPRWRRPGVGDRAAIDLDGRLHPERLGGRRLELPTSFVFTGAKASLWSLQARLEAEPTLVRQWHPAEAVFLAARARGARPSSYPRPGSC